MAFTDASQISILSGMLSGAFDHGASGADYDMTGGGDLYAAREANPYWVDDLENPGSKIVVNPWDPTESVEAYIAQLEEFEAAIEALDESTDWNAFIDTATTVAGTIFGDDQIQDAVTALDNRQQLSLNRAMNLFSGGMVLANAVNNSAYVIGLSNIALAHKQDVANFEADLTYNNEKERRQAIYTGAEMLRALRDKRIDSQQAAVHLRTELERLKIVAMSEFYEESMRRARSAVQWNLELHQFVGNFLGAESGGVLHPGRGDEISSAKSTIGGALTGAQAGAQQGIIGMGVGALIGGYLGNKSSES